MTERDQLRMIFFESFRKYQEKLPLEPLENQLVNIILQHPEYHAELKNPENIQNNDFDESNPFLHLGLHLALHEQISTNRPFGIKEIYTQLCKKYSDTHLTEHKMMECLAQILWDAQQSMNTPNEKSYLEKLKQL